MSHTRIVRLVVPLLALAAGCLDAVGPPTSDAATSPARTLGDAERLWALACPSTTELGLCVRPATSDGRDLCPDGVRAASLGRVAITRVEPTATHALAELDTLSRDLKLPAAVRAQAALHL